MKLLQKQIHKLAREKVWWDKQRSPLEIHALTHSEVSEATEVARRGYQEEEFMELGDVIIRILDYAEYYGFDMKQIIKDKHNQNKGRAHRHGGKLY